VLIGAAYLARAKAARRTEWHSVRENPQEIPK